MPRDPATSPCPHCLCPFKQTNVLLPSKKKTVESFYLHAGSWEDTHISEAHVVGVLNPACVARPRVLRVPGGAGTVAFPSESVRSFLTCAPYEGDLSRETGEQFVLSNTFCTQTPCLLCKLLE